VKAYVFFSWQSDSPATGGREFVQSALTEAVAEVAKNTELVVRPEVDHDTKNVPGAPAVVAAILEKIDQCSVLVADVTLTHVRDTDGPARRAPNPNVLLELGYALKRLSPSRILLIQDTTLGVPDALPFDLRGNRVLAYSSRDAVDDPESARLKLVKDFRTAIELILSTVGPPADVVPPVTIDLSFQERYVRSDRHGYRLPVFVTNNSDDILADWSVELRFPRRLLEPNNAFPIVGDEANGRVVIMRRLERDHSGPFYPHDKKETLGIDYFMDDQLFEDRKRLFAEEVRASFFVGSKRVAQAVAAVRDLQHY
jgi:hypothetical protein